MVKSPDAFKTISEVADTLEVPQHVLRFWESKFSQLRPMKRGGGRRYYRPEDVALLKGIRHLLYDEGYTIRGVQKILKEQGAKAVAHDFLDDDEDSQPDSVPDPVIATTMEPVIDPVSHDHTQITAPENRATPAAEPIIPADHIGDDDVKKLQATLFELSEIRRLLRETRDE